MGKGAGWRGRIFKACGRKKRAPGHGGFEVGIALLARDRIHLMNSDTSPDTLPNDSTAPWTGALPTPLKRLLTDELRAGNSIQYVAGCGLDPETALLILLARPFLSR